MIFADNKRFNQPKRIPRILCRRNGDFDTMVASAVKRGQKAYGTANSSLILVIPIPLPIWIASNNSMTKYGIPMNSMGYIIKLPSQKETRGLWNTPTFSLLMWERIVEVQHSA